MEEAATAAQRAQQFRDLFSDRAALRSWFDDSLPKLLGFVFARCGGVEAVAQDIVQETFLEAVRSRESFDGRSEPTTWLVGIARHKVADHFRRAYRDRRQQMELVESAQSHTRNPEAELDQRDAVLRALHELPEAQRVVVAMHYLDGHSVKEISSALGRTESAVESLLARGRERFRRVYLEAGEK